MNNRRTPPPLDQETRHRLAQLITRVGERRAVEILDTPKQTLARAAAGLGVRRATADVIAMRLSAVNGRGRAA